MYSIGSKSWTLPPEQLPLTVADSYGSSSSLKLYALQEMKKVLGRSSKICQRISMKHTTDFYEDWLSLRAKN